MTLTEMKIGIAPYSDGSGFEIEVKVDKDGSVSINQGDDAVLLKDRNQCDAVVDAIERLLASRTEIENMRG